MLQISKSSDIAVSHGYDQSLGVDEIRIRERVVVVNRKLRKLDIVTVLAKGAFDVMVTWVGFDPFKFCLNVTFVGTRTSKPHCRKAPIDPVTIAPIHPVIPPIRSP